MNKDIKIKIKDLTKYYGKTRGIENLNLEIHKGEIFGFLGPNGAGKTTTIRCMMNILIPTKGDIWINSEKISRMNNKVRDNIGYIPENLALPDYYTANEFISYVESMRGKPASRKKELIKKFDLPYNKKIRELSKGNKQKISVISAFMHDPDVLILDEPTAGLDPLLQQEVYEMLIETKERGKTIFFSSHNLAEVQQICDRVGIIKDGFLVNVENIDDLSKKVPRILEARLKQVNPSILQNLGDNLLSTKDNEVKILLKQNDSIDKFLELLIPMGLEELAYPPGSLREYFMQFYGKQEEL